MNLVKRLRKIEQTIKPDMPDEIFIYVESEEKIDEKIREYREKYGEDYRPRIMIRNPQAVAEEKRVISLKIN